MSTYRALQQLAVSAPWRRGGHWLALDIASGGCGQGGDRAIPQTSTGSRNDRRVPDDAMANGSGGALPTARVHYGAQPGVSARVRGSVDDSPRRRAPIRRCDDGYTPGPRWLAGGYARDNAANVAIPFPREAQGWAQSPDRRPCLARSSRPRLGEPGNLIVRPGWPDRSFSPRASARVASVLLGLQ